MNRRATTNRIEGFFDPRTYLDRDKFLSKEQLERLESHKYCSEGTSISEPLFQKFWNKFVLIFPLWVAPNAITLSGLLVNVSCAALLFICCPTAKCNKLNDSLIDDSEKVNNFLELKPWMFLINAIALFIYQTFDAVDGKQARRTNTSSPLGELFDHGMDSISTFMIMNALLITMNAGNEPRQMILMCLITNSAFYISHWSTYINGKLQFAYFDVTESQLAGMLQFFITYLMGQDIWEYKIMFGLNLKYISFYIPICLLSFRLIRDHTRTIIKGGVGPNGSTVAETSVLSPSTPLFILLTIVLLIYAKSGDGLMDRYPVLFTTTVGICFAKISNKLIIAHMSKSSLEVMDKSFLGLIALLLNQYFDNIVPMLFLLWLSFYWVSFDLLFYVISVYKEIAIHFKINILSISKNRKSSTSVKKYERNKNTTKLLEEYDSSNSSASKTSSVSRRVRNSNRK